MTRYVLRYTGEGPVPADEVEQVREAAHVVDEHGRTLLVEAPRARVQTLVKQLPRWVASPETVLVLPPTRPVVKTAKAAAKAAKRPRRSA